MKFINILGQECEFDCMGCDIANHKLIPPGGYVYEDDFINISADPEIPIPGFMILGIKKHVKSLNDLTDNERLKIINILNLSISKIKDCKIAEEVILIQEERSKHFHIWIVPVLKWMEQFNKSVTNIDKIINYSKEIYNEEIKDKVLEYVRILKESFNMDILGGVPKNIPQKIE